MSNKYISVLIVESSKKDTELVLGLLKEGGVETSHEAVTGLIEFREALERSSYDLILSDFDNTSFNHFLALEYLKEFEIRVPFLVLGTNIDRETAIAIMNYGARDYMLKSNLYRLVPVVERELHINTLTKKNEESESRNRLLSYIIQKSLNEIYLVDPDTLLFTYVNKATLDNLGYTEDEFYKLTFLDITKGYDLARARKIMDPLISGEIGRITIRGTRIRKNGSTYPVETHAELIHRGDQRMFMGISFDISQQHRDAETIKEQKEIAKRLESNLRYKSNFIANLSHEMRTTLNSILLLSTILKDTKNDNMTEEQQEYLDLIHTSNNSLLELLNKVLDMSKIEAGSMGIQLETVDFREICERIERFYKPIAKDKNLDFEYLDLGAKTPLITTDRIRLEQILNNLISNALKFTKEGAVALKVFSPSTAELAEEEVDSDKAIAFQVIDTGIGVPKEKQAFIFESYRQAEDSQTEKEFGGTGLGLSISSEIAKIMGGKLTLQSSPGQGSIFTLYLPCDSTKAVDEEAKKGTVRLTKQNTASSSSAIIEEVPNKKLSKDLTILLIDDSAIHNLALKEFLGFKFKECFTAESASEAYEVLRDHHVDIIVLDMYLPDASGEEVLWTLKNHDDHKEIPIIIYSGKSLSATQELKLKEHSAAIVQKNVDSYKVLLNMINDIVSKTI